MSAPAEPEPVDAEVVPDEQLGIATTTAVVRRERRSEVIRPLDGDQLVDSFKQYQALLPTLLDASDYQGTGNDRFVRKSGWRKIATAFDLDVQILRSLVERDEGGSPVRAEVWARAIAPSGRFMDGDGYCAISESRFARESGRQKLENDLRATATTRAMNRAISGLVGMGAVSAEEVDSGGPVTAPAEASTGLKQTMRNALHYLLDGDPRATGNAVTALDSYFAEHLPAAAGQAVVIVAKAVKAQRAAADADLPFSTDTPVSDIPVDDPGAPTELPEAGS